MPNSILTAVFVMLLGFGALAKLPEDRLRGRYGPEFTFTKDGSRPDDEEMAKVYRRMQDHLITNQPEGAKFRLADYVFTSPNGWWFKLNRDPGVFEIQMSPLSVDDIRRFKDDIQDAIFVSMANEGYFPWDYQGGGHLNIDTAIFGQDLLLLHNFIVDFWNHNELSLGALGYSSISAYPFALYRPDDQFQVIKILYAAEDNEYGYSDMGIQRFLKNLHTNLANGSGVLASRPSSSKHSDMHFGTPGILEVRSVRPQLNMDVWLHQTELIEARINYLRTIKGPISHKILVPLISPFITDLNDSNNHIYTPPVDPQKALRSFYIYVTQSGLPWAEHRDYIWPHWRRPQTEGEITELEAFEKSSFFLTRERLRLLKERAQQIKSCSQALQS